MTRIKWSKLYVTKLVKKNQPNSILSYSLYFYIIIPITSVYNILFKNVYIYYYYIVCRILMLDEYKTNWFL